jgi:hypothetical protein
MTTETKRRPADAETVPEPPSTLRRGYVVRGRTVCLAGISHGPGTVLELSADEHKYLTETGFLQAEPPILEPMTALESATKNPSNIGLQTQQVKFTGPVYTR